MNSSQFSVSTLLLSSVLPLFLFFIIFFSVCFLSLRLFLPVYQSVAAKKGRVHAEQLYYSIALSHC